ncbi:transposase [Aquipseudomonas alcaligenes]|nr:transposase [Pseudomonas alcaligenes]
MEMMGKIRRMYFRDKLSLHEIAKRHRVGAQHDSQVGQST